MSVSTSYIPPSLSLGAVIKCLPLAPGSVCNNSRAMRISFMHTARIFSHRLVTIKRSPRIACQETILSILPNEIQLIIFTIVNFVHLLETLFGPLCNGQTRDWMLKSTLEGKQS